MKLIQGNSIQKQKNITDENIINYWKKFYYEDSQYFHDFQKIRFDLNILVCGDYPESILEKELENIKIINKNEGLPYIKKGINKIIHAWNYYFFKRNKEIGENTFKFIRNSMIKNQRNNVILFYSGLTDFNYQNLILFYEEKYSLYFPYIIIVTKKEEKFILPELKGSKINLIKNIADNERISIYNHLKEISFYYNELGNDLIFPFNYELIEKDTELINKHLFTFNILVCGRPGAEKVP